jgi:predicted nucleotidyltransferase
MVVREIDDGIIPAIGHRHDGACRPEVDSQLHLRFITYAVATDVAAGYDRLVTLEELETILRRALGSRDLKFVLLFGSAVTAGPDAARDVDLAIAARSPLSLMARGALATDLEKLLGKPVDIVEVNEASTLFRWEVVRQSRVLVVTDERALAEFRALVPIEYAELTPFLEREAAGLRRALHG